MLEVLKPSWAQLSKMRFSTLENSETQTHNFTVHNLRVLLTTVLVSELLAVLITLATINTLDALWFELVVNTLFVQTVAAFTYLTWWAQDRFLPAASLTMKMLSSYTVALVITAILTWVLCAYAIHAGIQLAFHTPYVGVYVVRNTAITAIAGALAVHYVWVQHEWRDNIVRENEARIEALQARIRPHFLFNALNTIASLTRSNPEAAEESVEDLADLFRASLKKAGSEVRLFEELDTCRRYQRMEQFRLGDRLKVHWDVDGLPMNAKVPALCLQPILENAIYHGVELASNGGRIDITGRRDERGFTIEMMNPVPVQRGQKKHEGNKIALDNIRQRLELTYAGRSKLELEDLGDQYRVTLWFPWRKSDTPITPSHAAKDINHAKAPNS